MADDLGYECVRANGGTDYETPNLDALAASGIRFTRMHSQPLCTPSRVQLMTGLYNSRNYVRFGQLDPKSRTFGHWFRDHGYQTVIAGKWQLDGGAEAPRHFGFDRWCLWQITARPSRYWHPGLEVDGDPKMFGPDEFGPDVVADYVLAFLEEHAAKPDRPFFAYYPMLMPHDPWVPTPLTDDGENERTKSKTEQFPDFVHYTDALVGRVIGKLESLGLRDRTLILFVGDNGTHSRVISTLDGTPYPGGKGRLTRNGTHVPGIASWPGHIRPGQMSRALIDFSDFFPTLAEAAGIPLPADYLTDGISFLPVLEGSRESLREWSYCYYHRGGDRDKARQFVHNHRFKLYDNGQFFDLQQGLWEQRPIQDPTGRVYEALRDALDQQMGFADAATPHIRQRQRAMSATSYNKKRAFD